MPSIKLLKPEPLIFLTAGTLYLSLSDSNRRAAATTLFAGRNLTVVYHNPARLDFGQHAVKNIQINNQPLNLHREGVARITVPRQVITALARGQSHQVDIWLG